jgi:hypothetical protein
LGQIYCIQNHALVRQLHASTLGVKGRLRRADDDGVWGLQQQGQPLIVQGHVYGSNSVEEYVHDLRMRYRGSGVQSWECLTLGRRA